MSNFLEHCKKELTLAGLFRKDSDYDGMIGPAVMRLAKVHSKEGHSGYSSNLVITIFKRLTDYKTLTPITNNKKEWMKVTVDLWQNTRCGSCFSKDRGKTYYDIDEKPRRSHKTKDCHSCNT